MSRQQPHDFGFRIVVVAELRLLDPDMAELHAVEQMARELAAGARKIGPVRRMPVDDLSHPHLREHGEAEDHRQENEKPDQARISGMAQPARAM